MFDIFRPLRRRKQTSSKPEVPVHYWAVDYEDPNTLKTVFTRYLVTHEDTRITPLPGDHPTLRLRPAIAGLKPDQSQWDTAGHQLSYGLIDHLAADLVEARDNGYSNHVNGYPPRWANTDTLPCISPVTGNVVSGYLSKPSFKLILLEGPCSRARELDTLELMALEVLMEKQSQPL